MLPSKALSPRYAELHCRSNFSFLTGASHPKELVARALQLGYGALAITDECSLSGVVHAFEEAQRCGLHLIVGATMWVGAAEGSADADPPTMSPMRLVLLAQTRAGYGHLSEWITLARRRAGKGHYHAYRSDIEAAPSASSQANVPDGPALAGLPGCLALLSPNVTQPLDQMLAHAQWLKAVFGDRAAMALSLLLRARDDVLIERVRQVADITGLPIAAAGDVLMHVRSRKPLQDTLTATRLGLPLAQCGWQLEPNAEQHLRPIGRLQALHEPAWLAQTVSLAERCTFSLAELRYEYPDEIVPPGTTPASHLRALTEAGALKRYPPEKFPHGVPPKVREQIEHELALIARLHYEPYFLTVADIVQWARAQSILCQGRGSAANSTVCYCLQVTEVDPARQHTLFERFISVERNEPPDIDIDFEHQRREEVIQYIYRKYGRDRAALTAVITRYRPRSALRDVGRALGLDLQRIDGVAKSQQWFDGRSIDPERLREKGFDLASPITRLWMELTEQLIGFPRHLSQHPGGFVISRGPLAQLVPIENAAMEGRSVIQWDKDDLDALGLLKVDILALGMLTALRRSLDLIGQKLGRRFELQDVPPEDAATYDMICKADTVGVFQIESRAQMSMLPRLKPREFYDLVVEVAIVRPGPIQGGMVHPYLRRRDGLEPVTFPKPEIEVALSRTKGVPIFQEQVMQLAVLAADFTPGEADSLRRGMAAWKRKGGLGPFHERLVGRMVEKGYERDFAESIFKQIEGFGEYGFPESHAASFALLVYASSWIKCHHPDAFLVALLNSQPMGFYQPAQLVRDAREHGVEVRPVDVRFSLWDSSLEGQGDGVRAVRLGLNRIGGLAPDVAGRIVQSRQRGGAFGDLEALTRRATLGAHELKLLADADALRGLVAQAQAPSGASPPVGHRHQAAWAVAAIEPPPSALLHDMRRREDALDAFPPALAAPSAAEDMRADYRSLGLTLNHHPLALLRAQLDVFRIQTAAVLRGYPSGRIARASGIVTHRQRPGTAKGTVFVTLEDDTGSINVIVRPAVAQAQRQPLLAATLLTVYGQWQRHSDSGGEHAVMHLLATRLIDHTALLDGLTTRSRDFR